MKKIILITFIMIMLLSACQEAGAVENIGTHTNTQDIWCKTTNPIDTLDGGVLYLSIPHSGTCLYRYENLEKNMNCLVKMTDLGYIVSMACGQ